MSLEARVGPSIAEGEAVRIARELYGVEASAQALPGEYDDNFHLTGADGQALVLKVMHPARERSFIDMQCQALRHLAQRSPHLSLPRVLPDHDGELFSTITIADGSTRAVWIKNYVQHIADAKGRALVEKFLGLYDSDVVPALPRLRRSVIYGDANDYNVLVSDPWPQPRTVTSVIDFGDMHHGLTVSEPAIAAAYAILGKKDPLEAGAAIVAGYHKTFPLEETELAALYALIGTRLAVSVVNSACRKLLKPDDPYVTVSEASAWEALERLAEIHPRLAHYTFRAACGLPAVPQSEGIKRWLQTNARSVTSVLETEVRLAPSIVFDFSVGSTFLGAGPSAGEPGKLTQKIFSEIKQAGADFGVGRYDEPRSLYTSPLFGAGGDPTDERRTVHLGIDLFVEPGTPIRAPLAGVVHILANNAIPLDFGPLVVLKHVTDADEEFFTLYGHLTEKTLHELSVGQQIAKGEVFAHVGAVHENGGWAPHVHFQVILDL